MTPLLDTHMHLVLPETARCSWTDDIPVLAGRAFTLDDYAAVTAGKGVGAKLFMETGVDDADYQAEIRHVAGLAADPGNGILGLIASCRPEIDAGFDAWLEECADLPVVGFRRILHVVDDAMSRDAGFRANIRKIGRRGLTFDMCFLARQLPIALDLAKACDGMSLILDHCGVPDIAGGETTAWRRDMNALAALPNVTCKLSGVMAYCAPGEASAEAIRPWVAHVLEAFGPDRILWGGDWPVVDMANGLGDWIDATRGFLDALAPAESAKIAHETAMRVYGVPFPQASAPDAARHP